MRLLAVHPNYELYGSDRAFAAAIGAIRERMPSYGITVLLPQRGPLLSLPVFRDIHVQIENFWVARRRDLHPRRLPAFVAGGLRHMLRARRQMRDFDLVYIDTIVCLGHILAARSSGVPTLIHVHEIPLGIEMAVFRRLLIRSGATIAFNSAATRDAFALPDTISQTIVYNGTPIPASVTPSDFDGRRRLRILQIGRISFWKGQEVLVDAIARLPAQLQARLDVRIVGGVFDNQVAFHDRLVAQIRAAGLDTVIHFSPFVDDTDEVYRAADVIVVPSTRPEPFGRVAIEAMAHARAVIASAHGGLVESVQDGDTGHLFPPSDAAALSARIAAYLDDPVSVRQHGELGHDRFRRLFTDKAADRQIIEALHLAQNDARRRR